MMSRFYRSSVLARVLLLQLVLMAGCNSYSSDFPTASSTTVVKDTCIDRDLYIIQRKEMEKRKKYMVGFWLLLGAALIPLELLASSLLVVKIYKRVKQRKKSKDKL